MRALFGTYTVILYIEYLLVSDRSEKLRIYLQNNNSLFYELHYIQHTTNSIEKLKFENKIPLDTKCLLHHHFIRFLQSESVIKNNLIVFPKEPVNKIDDYGLFVSTPQDFTLSDSLQSVEVDLLSKQSETIKN